MEKIAVPLSKSMLTTGFVISAIRSNHHEGCTEAIATRGAVVRRTAKSAASLVPSDDYKVGFVIDESCHRVYAGPSDFVGWKG
ncbi:hypothetical protein FHX14_005483 [Rhizobium sp. BK619]|uniref:hypothetical protein n=1 Tax=Rhizobium sp. BK619 TaxID=2586989 RepID=UPI00161E54E3|nr:hypothetical protein [Rhizobium sp. BK619]MBB3649249.1 hypothetical protein [Rhizobium sp. BK619]